MQRFIFIWLLIISILTGLPLISQIPEKENLGPNINTEFDEFLPIISADGKSLYFCRQGDPSNIGASQWHRDQDIWFSEADSNGRWSKAINMGEPLNTRYPNGVLSISPDGNSLLLFGIYKKNGEPERGLSLSKKTLDGWSYPVKVIIDDFYNRHKQAQYAMSSDGKVLFHSMERDDSRGGRDLYISFLKDDDTWTAPKNMGDILNTAMDDGSPFLAADGETFYFASEGHGGFGEADIFMTRRLDNSWTNWSEPQNLGPLINTPKRDYYYRIPASGEYAYFVSEDKSFGGRDLFRIKLADNMKPKPVVLVYGKVLNAKTENPIEAKVLYETLPEGMEIGIASSDPAEGKYKIILPAGEVYGFRAEANGYFSINYNLDLSKIDEYAEIERDLHLVPIEEKVSFRLNNIFFDYNEAVLKKESFPELKRVVEFLKEYPAISIEIAGHTDDVGSPKYNLSLSEARAKSVADYLIKAGIAPRRIKHTGYGETKPLKENNSEENRQFNRRVEFIILAE